MQFFFFKSILCLFILAGVQQASASAAGKAAAMKYFTKGAKSQSRAPASTSLSASRRSSVAPGDQVLGLALGSLLNSQTYNWTEEEFSGWNLELFYQKPTEGYFGRGYHLELQKFATEDEELTKVSVLMSLTFPRRLSFPVFLGVAFGPGYFLDQQESESEFTFDYKAYLGFRLSGTHSQYFLQSGVKNHVHVLSDGQFIGWFISSGVAYRF